jgi:hypothetical protein
VHRDGTGLEREVPTGLAATTERLGHTSFADLDPDEIAEVRQLVRRIVLSTPVRRPVAPRPRRGSGPAGPAPDPARGAADSR